MLSERPRAFQVQESGLHVVPDGHHHTNGYGTVAASVDSTGVTAMTFPGLVAPPLQRAIRRALELVRTVSVVPAAAPGKVRRAPADW
jgi:hypothetical protein